MKELKRRIQILEEVLEKFANRKNWHCHVCEYGPYTNGRHYEYWECEYDWEDAQRALDDSKEKRSCKE